MSLDEWLSSSWINAIEPSAGTIASLLAIADREIADASGESMSPDGRFGHAYGAIRALCEAALRAAGYVVPKSGRKHERVLQSLQFTIDGDWTAEVDFFDRARRLRHQTIYERTGVVQPRDADDLLATAKRLVTAVREWLRDRHPDLA